MIGDGVMSGRARGGRVALLLAVALPLLFMMGLRLSFLAEAELDVDGFYHVAMADFGWEYFSAKEMPHLTMSAWGRHFSDKELLFHLLLSWVRGAARVAGLADFPFHLPSQFLVATLLSALVGVCWWWRIRQAWVVSLLLVLLLPGFTARMLMVRPHVLAAALMLLATGVLVGIRRPRECWRAVLLGWLFAWSYSNPHFILLPAAAAALPWLLRRRWWALLLPLLCLAGVALGYVLHPQFPHTFVNWKIQCVDVPRLMLVGGGEVVIGDEMLRRGFTNWADAPWGLVALMVGNVALLGLLRRKYSWRRVPRSVMAAAFLALVSLAGVVASIRALEHALPFALLAAGVMLSAAYRYPRGWPQGAIRLLARGRLLVAILLVLAGVNCVYRFSRAGGYRCRPLTDFARWTEQVGWPMGTVIGNVNWSDFPLLLYSAPQFRYLCGIEPMFGYAAYPEQMRQLELFRTGRLPLSPEQLQAVIGTPFAYVSPRNRELARDMAGAGFRIIYQGEDGWLFLLTPDGNEAVVADDDSPDRAWRHGRLGDPDFFPLGVWLQNPRRAADYQALGINLYVGLWQGPTDAQLALLRQPGMAVVCAQNEVGLARLDDPLIMAWMHGDEPDNAQAIGRWRSLSEIRDAWPDAPDRPLEKWGAWGPPVPPSRIITDYRRMRELDPSRPVMLNLGQGVAWDEWHGRGMRTGHPEDYREYVKGADIVSFDIYPVNSSHAPVKDQLWRVPGGVERLRRWAGDRIVWNVIECTGQQGAAGRPTPEQVRAQVWMSLIHGSRGIVYFVHVFKPAFIEAGLLADAEMSAAVAVINRQISELAPVLNSPSRQRIAVHSANADVPVAIMEKERDGVVHLFAVGMRDGETRATFTIPGWSRGRAEVLGEDRFVEIVEGRFDDRFGPCEVHLYRLHPGGG